MEVLLHNQVDGGELATLEVGAHRRAVHNLVGRRHAHGDSHVGATESTGSMLAPASMISRRGRGPPWRGAEPNPAAHSGSNGSGGSSSSSDDGSDGSGGSSSSSSSAF